MGGQAWPAWLVVAACGAFAQVFKLAMYGAVERRLRLGLLAQSYGLPSLPAAALGCLVTLMIVRHGWASAETGFALVFAVIGVHDTLKLGETTRRQREALFHVVDHLPPGDSLRQRVADYLDPRTHHPVHMGLGALVGVLFALAFAAGPR